MKRASRSIWLHLGIALLGLLLPGVARADGLPMPSVTAGSAQVDATRQRAVMWLRNGTWEIHIQPVFDREQAAAAWVVPFVVQPEVHQGNGLLFEHLERLTAPVFIEYCCEASCPCVTGGGGSEVSSGNASVTVWQQGTVGALDYVVLSTTSGDSLATWLATEGYQTPAGFTALLADFETEGIFFFVARLSDAADPSLPLDPVRFVLPGMDPPTYPLRLTALGVVDKLDLTVWVVLPQDVGWAPSSHPWAPLSGSISDPDSYDAALAQLLSGAAAGGFALLAAEDAGSWYFYDATDTDWSICLDGDDSCTWEACVEAHEVGLEPEQSWADDIMAMQAGEHLVFRYYGRLTAATMAQDLTLQPVAQADLPRPKHVFGSYTGTCPGSDCSIECPSGDGGGGSSAAGTAGAGAAAASPASEADDGCGCRVVTLLSHEHRAALLLLLLSSVLLRKISRRRRSRS